LHCFTRDFMNAEFVISSWSEAFIPLRHYTTYVGSCLLTFQDSLSVLPLRVKQSKNYARNRWICQHTGDGVSDDWFSGRKRSQSGSCSIKLVPQWQTPICSPMHGVNLDRSMLDKILYVADNNDLPHYLLPSFVTLHLNTYKQWFHPLLRLVYGPQNVLFYPLTVSILLQFDPYLVTYILSRFQQSSQSWKQKCFMSTEHPPSRCTAVIPYGNFPLNYLHSAVIAW